MKRIVSCGLVLMTLIAAGAASAAVAAAAATTQTPSATSLSRGPYSGAPSADSIVISWVVSSALPATLEIAPVAAGVRGASPAKRIPVDAPADDAHGQVDVLVDGLEPATAYVYRVIVQSGSDATTSPIGHFRTAPARGEPVAFAVLADTQWQWEGADRLHVIGDAVAFDSARSGGFDFILHAGDLVETPNAYYWEPWFDAFESMLLAAPFIPVLGNHEKNSLSYYNAFSHPAGAGQNGERWWTLRWGDLVIVGLDTAATRADRILEQQAYARAQLAGLERWKFVIFHHPVYSSDAYHGSGYGYETIYHPIFVEAGVDIVFNGHAHNYERIEKDGVVYLVLGGGGAVPRSLAPERVEGSVVAIEDRNFYARVAVDEGEVAVDVVAVARATETTFEPTPGEILDSCVIRKAVDVQVGALLPETPAVAAPELALPELASPELTSPELTASGMPAPAPELLPVREVTVYGSEKPERPVTTFVPPPAWPEVPGLGVAILASIVALVAAVAWVFLRIGD